MMWSDGGFDVLHHHNDSMPFMEDPTSDIACNNVPLTMTIHQVEQGQEIQKKQLKSTLPAYSECINYIPSFRTWIGIHDLGNDNEGTFRCTADEEKISYDNWYKNEPNDWGKGGEDCTELNRFGKSQQWNDIACSHSKPFVCELAQEKTCPEGTTEEAEKCYKFVNNKKTFHDAENECKEGGGHLACPQSQAENEAIHALAKQRYLGFLY